MIKHENMESEIFVFRLTEIVKVITERFKKPLKIFCGIVRFSYYLLNDFVKLLFFILT